MSTPMKLVEWAESKRQEGFRPFLLIDGAQAEGSHLILERWQVPYKSLFEDTSEKSLIEIAPLLISLGEISPELLRKVCGWALDLAYRFPCLTWITGTLPADQMARHLRQFHSVSLSDSQTMMLRWYDTRILPIWSACLNPSQRAHFMAGAREIRYIDRLGETIVLTRSEQIDVVTSGPSMGRPLIRLDTEQYGILIDASGADSLVNHLRRVITDETNRLSSRVLFEFVCRYRNYALQAGVDDLDRQTQYLLLALYTSGKGIEHPAFVEFIKTAPASLTQFFDAMRALPDAVWSAGEPLWSSTSYT
jgi:hypothetical protein